MCLGKCPNFLVNLGVSAYFAPPCHRLMRGCRLRQDAVHKTLVSNPGRPFAGVVVPLVAITAHALNNVSKLNMSIMTLKIAIGLHSSLIHFYTTSQTSQNVPFVCSSSLRRLLAHHPALIVRHQVACQGFGLCLTVVVACLQPTG